MEHIKIEIKGNIHKYTELTAEQGYCFYDIDAEERHYMTSISTPILDETELARKYIVIQGDAEKLNDEWNTVNILTPIQDAREIGGIDQPTENV